METATYGSKYVAAQIATKQIMDLVYTFCYPGVHVHQPIMLFGDNESIVKSSSIPSSQLKKRHVALSFHQVCEAITAKLINFNFI